MRFFKHLDNPQSDSLAIERIGINNATTVKSFTLRGKITQDIINVVNQLTELETLSIKFYQEIVQGRVNFAKLKNLKDLTMKNVSLENLPHFAKLNTSQITSLAIVSNFYVSADLIHATAKLVPNLKVLRWTNSSPILNKLIAFYPNLKKLTINKINTVHRFADPTDFEWIH